MPQVFINYRREDSAAVAGRLFDRCSARFGHEHVFRDVDRITPGAEYPRVIAERIAGCDALVAVIGQHWLDCADGQGRRRLDDPTDFVRTEIAAALSAGKRVVPVLVAGAAMPPAAALPPPVAALAERQAVEISEQRFDFDVARLLDAIEAGVPNARWRRRPAMRWRALALAALLLLGAGVAFELWRGSPGAERAVGVSARGAVSASAGPGGTAVIAGGNVTIGITLEQHEAWLKRRELELRREFERARDGNRDKLAALEQELGSARSRALDPQADLLRERQVLAGALAALDAYPQAVPAADLEAARRGLAAGETAAAESVFTRALASDGSAAAAAAFQLGALAERRIEFVRARAFFDQAARLEPGNADYLLAAAEIADTLHDLAGAERLYRRALAVSEQAPAVDLLRRAKAQAGLARIHYQRGEVAAYIASMQEVLALREKALGPEHPTVAGTLASLAVGYMDQGDPKQAQAMLRRALRIQEQALGTQAPEVADTLVNLAVLLTDGHGDWEEAERLYRRALDISRLSHGEVSPHTAAVMQNLGLMYSNQRRFAQADPLLERALQINERAFGPEHPNVGQCLHNLARSYHLQGRFAEAEPLYKRGVSIYERAVGYDHPDAPRILHNYSVLLRDTDRPAEADALEVREQQVRERRRARRTAALK